jgi:hypothetical protein
MDLGISRMAQREQRQRQCGALCAALLVLQKEHPPVFHLFLTGGPVGITNEVDRNRARNEDRASGRLARILPVFYSAALQHDAELTISARVSPYPISLHFPGKCSGRCAATS